LYGEVVILSMEAAALTVEVPPWRFLLVSNERDKGWEDLRDVVKEIREIDYALLLRGEESSSHR
jgi:hypothetical protein